MGAIVSMPADISALEKQTIVNTRANKLRYAIEKFPVLTERRARSESPLSRSECKLKALSVGFGSIVRERVYSNQDPPSSSLLYDFEDNLMNRQNRRSCARFSTCLYTKIKAEYRTMGKVIKNRRKYDYLFLTSVHL